MCDDSIYMFSADTYYTEDLMDLFEDLSRNDQIINATKKKTQK